MVLLKRFPVLMAAVALLSGGCGGDEAGVETPTLNTHTATIEAGHTAGSYSIAITSNTAWTATGTADWCTLQPAAGTGNGTIIVNVAENPGTEPRTVTAIIATGTLVAPVTIRQAGIPVILTTNASSIPFDHTGGSQAIAVTSNTAWTVSITTDAGTDWCTLSASAGTGNGTITVNATENTLNASRFAFITFVAGSTQYPVTVAQEGRPGLANAASAQTWTFDNVLVWSDAINVPECANATFAISSTEPHCRSYTHTSGTFTHTYYYYNWPYVNANKAALCPNPWHVPTADDFNTLRNIDSDIDEVVRILEAEWGKGGIAYNADIVQNVDLKGFYWSSTPIQRLQMDMLFVYPGDAEHGYQVRCVK